MPLSNIFTKDITTLTYLILCGSIVYLIISVSEMNTAANIAIICIAHIRV